MKHTKKCYCYCDEETEVARGNINNNDDDNNNNNDNVSEHPESGWGVGGDGGNEQPSLYSVYEIEK